MPSGTINDIHFSGTVLAGYMLTNFLIEDAHITMIVRMRKWKGMTWLCCTVPTCLPTPFSVLSSYSILHKQIQTINNPWSNYANARQVISYEWHKPIGVLVLVRCKWIFQLVITSIIDSRQCNFNICICGFKLSLC